MAIFGTLSAVRSQLPDRPSFEACLAYLAELLTPGSEVNRRVLSLAPGVERRVELGGGVHALEQAYETRSREEGRFESHLAHVDVQVVVGGEEVIAVAPTSLLSPVEDQTPGNDIIFYAPHAAGSALHLRAGDVAVLFPADGHLGRVRVGPAARVWKSVVKVPVR